MIPAAVLFDCDGVVVDSEPATFALIREDLAAHGLTLTAEEADHHFLGGTIRGVGDKARSLGARLPPLWHEDFYDRLYARLAEGTPLIGGVVAVFDALDAGTWLRPQSSPHTGRIARRRGWFRKFVSICNPTTVTSTASVYIPTARWS